MTRTKHTRQSKIVQLSRRAFLRAAPVAVPVAAFSALAAPARASMGAGRYVDSRVLSGPYTVTDLDADTLLLIDVSFPGAGDIYLDDAFPIGSGFGVMKNNDGADVVFVRGDTLGVDGYNHIVFHIKGMGGDFYRTGDGWRYLPFGPQVSPVATLHRTVVAPLQDDIDRIGIDENHGKTIRYNCDARAIMAVLPDPSLGRWGLTNSYRAEMQVAIQHVGSDPSNPLTLFVAGDQPLNGRPGGWIFPLGASAVAFSDGQMWSFLSSHGL